MIISCPSCPQKLRVPEELFGRAVKCPKCGATFEAAGSAPAVGGSEAANAEAPPQTAAAPAALEDRDEAQRISELPQGRRVRRDTEPGRGTLILTMGILSIVLPAVGWVPGVIAIVMGRADQKKIKAGQMDRSASDLTQAGWICGIIGTCLHTISCLACGLYITMIVIVAATFAKGGIPKAGTPGTFPKKAAPMPAMPIPPPPPGVPPQRDPPIK